MKGQDEVIALIAESAVKTLNEQTIQTFFIIRVSLNAMRQMPC